MLGYSGRDWRHRHSRIGDPGDQLVDADSGTRALVEQRSHRLPRTGHVTFTGVDPGSSSYGRASVSAHRSRASE
jgi:hypothetical protein